MVQFRRQPPVGERSEREAIDYVRGLEQAAEFLDRTVAESRYTTIINSLEVLQGAQNRIEMRKLINS
jgi:hypothetical protein